MWPFRKKQQDPKQEEKEFTFIWYKKMVNHNTIHYTMPFRTKLKAANREEALAKLKNFALNKMTLVITEEKNFPKDFIAKSQQRFAEISKEMQEAFNDIEKSLNKTFGK